MFELLPNHAQFSALQENLQKLDAALAQRAFIAADSFNMAIKMAAQQNKDQFGKFFNRGVAEFNTLSTSLARGGAVAAMHGWLAAAMGHAQKTSALHFQRNADDQARYMQGREVGGQATAPINAPAAVNDTPAWKSNLPIILGASAALVVLVLLYNM